MSPFPPNHASTPDEQILLDVLQEQHHCLEQVTELLKTEHNAIIKHDMEQMGHILDTKLPLLSQLDQYDKQRQQFFQESTGLPYHDGDFSRYIKEQSSAQIQTIWGLITGQLPECKTQNEINGRIISMQQKNTEQVLFILTGQSNSNTQTYSHLGQTRPQKSNALYTSV